MEALRAHRHRRAEPDGGVVQVPLGEVAKIGLSSGAFYIYREQQERYIPVKFSVRGRDLGGAVLEAQQKVAEEVQLPSGYRLDWAGDFANFQNAIDRLSIAVPIAIALILLLLYVSFGSLRDTLLAGSAIPMALIGGILGLALADMSFSISAAIGFVALFGIAAMNGIMVVGCFNRLVDAGLEREAALRETCQPADAAGADDLRRGLRRPAAGRLLDRDRQPGPAPARHRRGRRHAAGADPVPHRAAGGDRLLLPPPRPGYIRGVTRPNDQFIDLGDRTLRVRRLTPRKQRRAGAHDAGLPARGAGLHRDVARLPAEALRRPAMRRRGLRPHRLRPVEPVARPIPASRYMEIEADEVLPRLLAALAIEDCVLVGHSDGGTIALNYAADDPEPLRAVVTLAAHAINEPVCVAAIRRARARPTPPATCASAWRSTTATMSIGAFHLWSDAWVAPGFEPMDANGRLPGVEVPVQAIQGEDDDYGSELQLGIIAGKVGGYCETRLVPDCGHSPHLQQPAYVLAEIARFVAPLALVG